ncbi:MAG: hypothetical protein ACPGVN_05870, partial [Alphaproteobacteria bacterium]
MGSTNFRCEASGPPFKLYIGNLMVAIFNKSTTCLGSLSVENTRTLKIDQNGTSAFRLGMVPQVYMD